MRFTLQDFVEQGLAESPPELRRAGGAVVRAAQTDDWSRLDRPTRKPASQLPPPEFWLALRRAFDAAPLLCAEGLATLLADDDSPPNVVAPGGFDLRLREAVAFVFPDEPSLWTDAEQRRARTLEHPSDGAFMLFATLRHVPGIAAASSWPPSPKLLKNLPDAQLEEALTLIHDELLLSQRRKRESVKQATLDVRPHLAHISAPDALSTLALITPTEDLIAQAEGFTEPGEPEQLILRRSFLEGWKRELHAVTTRTEESAPRSARVSS